MAKNKTFSIKIKAGDEEKTVNFTEVSLPHEEWEYLRDSADPEQLFLLGLGTKLRKQTLNKVSYIAGLIEVVLLGLSVLIGLFLSPSVAIILGVGSFLFVSLAIFSRLVRLEDTYDSILKALKNTQYYDALDNFHEESFAWYKILLIIPFFVIHMIPLVIDAICSMFEDKFPRLVAARTKAVFAVPEGCGMDDIIAMSDFYHETFEEMLEHAGEDLDAYNRKQEQKYIDDNTYTLNDAYGTVLKPTGPSNYDSVNKRYEYKDQSGYIWYSDDNKSFYQKK